MNNPEISRRSILLACGAAVAAVACGEDDSGGGGGTAGTGGATGGTSGAGGSSTGGSSTGGSSTGGVGGSSTGGSTTGGTGGSGTGGVGGSGSGGVCGAMLLVKGSNYASDPHDIMIPVADIIAGQPKTYESTGTNHVHEISLTAADFTALRNGETVTKYDCFTDSRFTDHEFAISCDPSVAPMREGEIGTKGNCPS